MFEVRQETTVAAAHQLRLSPGEGERLHGHNWRIVAVVRCQELDSRGMVVDFNDLGAELRKLVEPYEHVFLNEIAPYDDINPTAENIAVMIWRILRQKIDSNLELKITLYETERNFVEYPAA